jgi:hypothetical protein
VPVFCLWHEPHDPSSGLAEFNTTAPDSWSPFCVTVQVNVSGPCASSPVPFHAPVRLADVNPGTVVVVVGVLGAAGFGADELQAVVMRIAAASSGIEIFTALEYRPSCEISSSDSRRARTPATRASRGRF